MAESWQRRGFLKGALAMGAAAGAGVSAAQPKEARPNRRPWIATVSLDRLEPSSRDDMVKQVIRRMNATLDCSPSLICLPEAFPFHNVPDAPPARQRAEQAVEILPSFQAFARDNACWLVCPMLTVENGRVYNSAVVINREGGVAGAYHKMHPTTDEMESGIHPGPADPPVFDTDFGRIGCQICFDINWRGGWDQISAKGAEIIVWPSAFPGGRMLSGLAWMTKTVIVSSTRPAPSRIVDVDGEELTDSGRFETWACAPVNLEKAFIHIWPYTRQLDALRAKYGQRARVKKYHLEDWAIVESLDETLPVADLLREFEIPLHREHIRMADDMQREMRPA
ncbi:MAG: twin-arginine translocation signal domain-containing protein [bacterium]|nr:twin-arginine translocation signal domain-containing protein [bacterium]